MDFPKGAPGRPRDGRADPVADAAGSAVGAEARAVEEIKKHVVKVIKLYVYNL